MNIEFLSPNELIAYEFNNKIHPQIQIDRIANSISEFGFNQPIVIDEKNIILVGHGRWEAAKKLGIEKIPVLIKVDLTETQKKAYRILDNKLADDAEWKIESLELELKQLDEAGFKFEDFGLREFNFGQEIKKEKAKDAEDDNYNEESIGEIKQKNFIILGTLIELNQHRILCGDSTNKDDIQKLLNNQKPKLLVTDPPYGVNYDLDWREATIERIGKDSKGKVLNDDRMDWTDCYKLYGEQGIEVVYCWHGAKFSKEFAEHLQIAGFEICYQIIWAKSHFVFGRGDYHWRHEPCWYAVKKSCNHNWQGARDQSTLWEIANNNPFGNKEMEEKFGHGTQKPVECMARPMRNNSAKGDIVIDAFLGSGTSIIAAEQLGRICYGMELSPEYCLMSMDRYLKYCKDKNISCEVKVNGELYNPSFLRQ